MTTPLEINRVGRRYTVAFRGECHDKSENWTLPGTAEFRSSGEMVLVIPDEAYGPYLLLGQPNDIGYEAHNSAHGGNPVRADWGVAVGGQCEGLWYEAGGKWKFSFCLKETQSVAIPKDTED